VLVKNSIGKNSFKYDGNLIRLPAKISTIPFWSVLERYALVVGAGKAGSRLSRDELALRAKQFGLSPALEDSKEKIADEIFKKICRPKMIQPVYVVDYPIEISPLAKNLGSSKELVDRFQLIIGGIELINGFSELNDPEEQRSRFLTQEEKRSQKEKETHPMDEDFVEMLEYGMPPAAGLAISIDRLTMLLTDSHNIKEVILFPTMKPKV